MAKKIIYKETYKTNNGTITTTSDGKNITVIEHQKYDNIYNSRIRDRDFSSYGFLRYVFVVIFSLLLFVAVFRLMTNSTFEPLTFLSFLDAINTCPNVVLSNFDMLTIDADWGLFNFLRDFFNVLGSITSFALYFTSLILQIVVVVGHFLTQFFFVPASSV